MFKKIFALTSVLFITACQENPASMSFIKPDNLPDKYLQIIQTAESKATPAARQILVIGREMSASKSDILRGSCWDYANSVYNRAGYTLAKRDTILQGRKGSTSLPNTKMVQPGDFLSYLNHSYHNSEHSAIFIDWIDEPHKNALMLSYPGEGRAEPARYRAYDLSDVYTIVRPHNNN